MKHGVPYSTKIKDSAKKALSRIAKSDRIRIVSAIDRLAQEPEIGKPLQGEHSGLRRIRVGDYRVVYQVDRDALLVLVVRIGHRREVYR